MIFELNCVLRHGLILCFGHHECFLVLSIVSFSVDMVCIKDSNIGRYGAILRSSATATAH